MNGHTLGILMLVVLLGAMFLFHAWQLGLRSALITWAASIAILAFMVVGITLAQTGDLSSIPRMFGFH